MFSTKNIFQCHYLFLYSMIFMSMSYSYTNAPIIYLTTLSWKDTCTIIFKTAIVENMCIYQEVESLGQI